METERERRDRCSSNSKSTLRSEAQGWVPWEGTSSAFSAARCDLSNQIVLKPMNAKGNRFFLSDQHFSKQTTACWAFLTVEGQEQGSDM